MELNSSVLLGETFGTIFLQIPTSLSAEGHGLDEEEPKYLCFPFNHYSLICRELIEKMRLGRSKTLLILLRVIENCNLKN